MSHLLYHSDIFYYFFFFFFNDTATTEIYTLSLHDALPIYLRLPARQRRPRACDLGALLGGETAPQVRQPLIALLRVRDRKSTRLNSSHSQISYAVFCLKKKKITAVLQHFSIF